MSDDHFQQMLAPAMRPVSSSTTKPFFIASKTFTSKREGYYFTKGESGLGYYFDTRYSFKRKATDQTEDESTGQLVKKSKASITSSSSTSIAKLLEQADANEIVPLDAASLKQSLIALDKKIIHNQKMRAKYFDEPENFMESEIVLNQAIGELNMVAASPELYNIFISTTGTNVSSCTSAIASSGGSSGNNSASSSLSMTTKRNGLLSLLNLITHENTDVSLSVLSLLAEMIDSEILLINNNDNEDEEEESDGGSNIMKESRLFLEAFISSHYQAFELLVQNLTRLENNNISSSASSSDATASVTEENEEDAQGVYNTLSIFENLINLHPIGLVDTICSRTDLLTYLITTIKKKKAYDMNKLYCTEILSILLQYSSHHQNAQRFCALKIKEYDSSSSSSSSSSSVKRLTTTVTEGMDMQLQCIAFYRKREPSSSDEQECIHNLFVSLCALLLVVPNHQDMFRHYEGFDLMIRCLKEQKYAALCAPKVIRYAITNHTLNCHALITTGGLKYIFPIFMHRSGSLPRPRSLTSATAAGGKSSHSSTSSSSWNFIKSGDVKEAEEENLTIITQLCLHINHISNSNILNSISNKGSSGEKDDAEAKEMYKDNYQRLLIKFIENDYEKLCHAVDLFVLAYKKLNTIDNEIRNTIQTLKQNIYAIGNDSGIDTDEKEEEIEGLRDQLDEYSSDENIQEMRNKGGLITLQQLSIIILFVCLHSPSSNTTTTAPTVTPAMEKVMSLLTSYHHQQPQLSLQTIIEFTEDRIEGLEKEILSIEEEKEEVDENELTHKRQGSSSSVSFMEEEEGEDNMNRNSNSDSNHASGTRSKLTDLTEIWERKLKEKSVLINWLVSLSQIVDEFSSSTLTEE